MSKNNIKIILFLLAVLIVGATYMYVYKPNMDDKAAIESEISTLETRLADLQAKEAHRDEYIAQTEDYKQAFAEIVKYFPATLDQEISVMFIKGIEEVHDGEFLIGSTGLGRTESFYTLGSGETVYDCQKAAFPITYSGSYDGVQQFMDYIMSYKYRMNISSVNISYDAATDTCSGSITMNAFCVNGDDREADKVNVDVPEGVSNLFIGGNAAPTSQSYSYDADNGASIVDDNDVKVILNNANNDTADGIIVTAGTGSTEISNKDNAVIDVNVNIYAQDGKNYIDYSIGDNKGTIEALDSDVKIYVESSERVDADDSNGVKLNVSNSTDLVVFVKVNGDDSASPRFNIGSKEGKVKVY